MARFADTPYSGPIFAVTSRRYGRTIEAQAVFVESAGEYRRLCGGTRRQAPAKRKGGARSESSIARSKTLLRRRAMAAQIDHLWTLTKRGKFATRGEALKAWERAERRGVGRLLGGLWVVAYEQHAEGGWHIHVGCHGFRPAGAMRRLWYRALGGQGDERGELTPGNVDVQHRRRGPSSPRRVARYLSKYVSKEAGASLDAGRKSFSSARGLCPSSVRRFLVPALNAVLGSHEAVTDVLELAYQRHFASGGLWYAGGAAGRTFWAEDG